MEIKVHTSGPLQTNAYLFFCPSTRQAAIVDCPPESFAPIVETVQREHLTPTAILLTHSHYDHIGDLQKLSHYFDIPVKVHALDKANIEQPGSDGIPFFLDIPPTDHAQCVTEGETLSIGELQVHILHTPGHSPGGVCYYLEAQSVLFSGDTLFKGSIGNLSLPTSCPTAMSQSLQKLASLPGSTLVYPGHGERTSLAEEAWIHHPEKVFPDLMSNK